MKTACLLASALWLVATPPVSAQDGCAVVEVQNLRPRQGHLMLAAYGSAEQFRKTPLTQLRLPAADGTMRVQLCGLAGRAEVALVLFQDLDSDGRLATSLLGLPTEPWGSSGTAGSLGPSWERGRVRLDGSVIVVRLSA